MTQGDVAMVKVPAAQPVPRVIRSRRDDRYQAGHPAPAKRANAGYVVSQQTDTDTVTVDILDNQIPGVVFLDDMPPVGAIVEVEARGDLLVIPAWYPGPPPPPDVCSTVVEFTNYTALPASPATASFTGSDPWGDEDSSTYGTATLERVSGGAFVGALEADFVAPAGVSAILDWTLEVDLLATNTGATAGPDFRVAMAVKNSSGTFIGEFDTVDPEEPTGIWLPSGGTVHSITVPYFVEYVPGALDIAVLGGGSLYVKRYSNFGFNTAPYSLLVRAERIQLTVEYDC